MKPKVLSRKEVFRKGFTRVEAIELDLGEKTKSIPLTLYPEVVVAVPLLDEDTVVMTKEFRPALDKTFISFPGGKASEGEDFEVAVKRELREETGYKAGNVKKLISYFPLTGLTSLQMHVFLAEGLTKTEQQLDEDESISVLEVQLKKIPELIASKEIAESKTLIGLAMLEKHLNKKIM